MADQITNYQCPACSGPLHFDHVTGKVKCDHCRSVFEVSEVERIFAEKDRKAEESFREAAENSDNTEEEAVISEEEKNARTESRWDDSAISSDWGEAAGQMRSYSCPSCGGEVICEQTTAATHCPFCGNPGIVPGQFAGTLRPDYVIPFALDKSAAVSALKEHYKHKVFLPKAFTNENHIQEIQGIYVPFWLFDGEAAAECRYEGRNFSTRREGDYKVTVTQHYDVRRNGTVSFSKVPADASKKMPDELMDSLEPYDYSGLKPFSAAYLPGYLADRFDVTVEESSGRIDNRCAATAEQLLKADIHGYQVLNEQRNDIYIARGKVHYALLPVWMLKTKWDNREYVFAMNGQTGKLVGDLPVSVMRFLVCLALLTVLFTAFFYLSGISGRIAGFLIGIFAGGI